MDIPYCDLNSEEIVGTFCEKVCPKIVKQSLELKKKQRQRVTNYMSNGKVMIVLFIVGLIKNMPLYKMSYYPEPDSHGRNKMKVELDLSNYGTKADLKGATVIDTSNLATKVDEDCLKADVDKIVIDKSKLFQLI